MRMHQKGFVALISVLVVTAVAVIIGTTIILRSLTHATTSLSEIHSAQAWASANGCAEYVLGYVSATSTSFTELIGSSTTLSIGGVPCYISTITATSGTPTYDYLLVKASSTVSEYVRKIQLVVATNTPSAVLDSWQEVGDF